MALLTSGIQSEGAVGRPRLILKPRHTATSRRSQSELPRDTQRRQIGVERRALSLYHSKKTIMRKNFLYILRSFLLKRTSSETHFKINTYNWILFSYQNYSINQNSNSYIILYINVICLFIVYIISLTMYCLLAHRNIPVISLSFPEFL